MVSNDAAKEFDFILEYIYARRDTIFIAHADLGIPLEQLIGAAAKQASAIRACDQHIISVLDESGGAA